MPDNQKDIYLTPDRVIVGFYNLLDAKQYEQAFECLSQDFRNRVWKNDLQRFADGYQYTINISTPALQPLSKDNDKAEYLVVYDDHINSLHHPLLDRLPKAEIKDLEMVAKNITAFRDLMVNELSANPEKVADIRLAHFFQPNAVETCLWLGEADYSRNEELFTRSPETVQVFRRAFCINTQNGWRIEGLKRN